MRKPFCRKARKCWFVKDEQGHFIRLDPDEDKAFRMWERMRQLSEFRTPDATVEAIFEAFLRDVSVTISEPRLAKYTYFLEQFALHFGQNQRAAKVTGADVVRWVRLGRTIGKTKRQWSVTRKRDAGQAVKRALGWAIRRGYLPWSDVFELEFETPEPSDTLITYEQHAKPVAGCCQPKLARPFALLLIALRLSGARRPIQVRSLTAAHVINGNWVFRKHKTAGKTGKPLVVRCGPCLNTLTRILVHFRPTGHLFLASHGKPWPKDGLALRFRRLRDRVGLEGIAAYSYRHSYATDALEAGISIPTVAALLGHSNPAMVARVYGHLEKKVDHLTEAARIRQPNSTTTRS